MPLSPDFLNWLICPECQQPLAEVESANHLKCAHCSREYPILNEIPRFVSQEHLASFGLQWNKYEVAHDDEDRATFEAKTGFRLNDLKGKTVLDAGCGGGRYSKICGEAGATVIAADHSSAVEKAKKLCNHLPNVHFLQGDLKQLPLQENAFDFAFSIGVMHHDAETRAVFDAVAKMVKPGGKLAVWLYRRNQFWQEWINNVLRWRTKKMPVERLERWSRFGAWLGGLPVIGKTANKVVNFSNHPNWENRVCDTFDWYSPEYQYHHTVKELTSWFEDADYDELIVLPPEKSGRLYRFVYNCNLLIGSGVNVQGTKKT